jgi:hypothetical protein
MSENKTCYIKLNLDKLKNLLDRHGYIIEQVYCNRDSIKFLECRTPKYQKTFIIYIPERYLMTLSSSTPSMKKINIIISKLPPSSQQITFMSDAKGPLLECDLLTISSQTMCLYLNKGEYECFYITDSELSESSDGKKHSDEDIDEIDTLERDTSLLLQKIKPGSKLPKAILRKKKDLEKNSITKVDDNIGNIKDLSEDDNIKDLSEDDNIKDLSEDDNIKDLSEDENIKDLSEDENESLIGIKDKKIELFFEEENGDSVDEIKSLIENSAHIEDSLSRIKEKIESRDSEDEEKDSENEEYTTRDNSLPPDIEEYEVVLGIIYILIDIRSFFKIVSTYEEELINNYNQIEDNEEEVKKIKLYKVKNLCNQLISRSELRLKEISEEEERLKIHLVRLTIVLTQSDSLKTRVTKNPTKYGSDVIKETTRIYQETRETIHELNMEILKLKDITEDLLSNYISSIQELIAL